MNDDNNYTKDEYSSLYNIDYFTSFNPERGYRAGGYRDFPTHWRDANIVYNYCKEHDCKSVLDVGGARGYIDWRLQNKGLKVCCMDISKHCYHTRVIDNYYLHDATDIPWKFKDKEFDIVVSNSFLEHLHEYDIDNVLKEMTRVSKQGLHGIGFVPAKYPNMEDDTHFSLRPMTWWRDKVNHLLPSDYNFKMLDNEKDILSQSVIVPHDDLKLNKLNLGSFVDCFYFNWTNIDIVDLNLWAKANGYNFLCYDLTKTLPYSNDIIDLIYTSNFLEHLDKIEGFKFLNECYRIMKEGALIRISVPDADKIMKAYLDKTIMEYKCMNVGIVQADNDLDAYYNLLLGGHKAIYNYNSLKQLLNKIGFTDIRESSPFDSRSDVIKKQIFPTAPTISLFVEANK